jgi:uncharacterized repeat protein (TIGR01451 family)
MKYYPMRILLASLIFLFASWLPGQCINVQIDSVFCLGNGEYGILYDVEGTGDNGWVLENYDITGSYLTDEIRELTGLNGQATTLVFRDSIDPDCVLEVVVERPDQCNFTDPCFGFFMDLESIPGSCGGGIRVRVEPADVGLVDSIILLNQAGDIVGAAFIPDFPDFVDFNDLAPGNYTVTILINGSCTLSEGFTVTQSADCGSISGFTWVDDNENGVQENIETYLDGVTVRLLDPIDLGFLAQRTVTPNGYFFNDLAPGDYVLQFLPSSSNMATAYQVGDNPLIDNDINEDFFTDVITVGANENVQNINGGFLPLPCSVVLTSDDVTCNGEANGSITADPTGQAPFTYTWSNGATTQTITGLSAGFYTVTVTDDSGCSNTSFINIGQASPLSVSIGESGNSCNSSSEEHFLFASIQGGTAPYTYEWSSNGVVTCQSANCFGPAPGSVYVLTLTDANGCTVVTTWLVSEGNFSINFFSPFYLPCDGSAVTISVGDSTEFDYVWISPTGLTSTGASVEATEIGIYSVTGTSPDNDCTVSGEATVLAALRISDINLSVIDSSECGFGQCVYPTFNDPIFQQSPVSYTWYGPDGNVYQTNGGFLCTEESGLFILVVEAPCDTITLSIDLNSSVECAALNGTVYIDDAGNCSFDAGDLPAAGILVHIASTNGTRNYYAITNDDGQYGQEVEVGEYTVTPITDPTRPFGQCDPAVTVTVVSGQPNQADAFLPVLLSCPLLTVDVSMPFLRRCFLSCAYIEYENEGSAVAEDAQLVVTLDPLFISVDPSVVPSMIDGTTYTFDLGDLPPFASGRIYFNFVVSCDADLGQSHCIEANITPNDICSPPDDWNGALVSVDPGTCNGNEVSFQIANIGDNTMSVPLSYVVVEDGIMMMEQPVVVEQLTADEIFTITLPADGQTYQVITNQEPNAPASVTPTALLEGCEGNTVNGGSTGFANILSLGNGFPSEAIVCRENVGAYDPNDKNGYPLGYGDDNNIAPGTELLYAIRFQNTGTDTAFNVVVRDTISDALDLSTFKAGASSHDYTVSIDSQRVVTFTFANIMLPDSNVNLLQSQGVVNFSIDHDPELVAGDLITNEAAIYFDFNEPVITNTSLHQIEKDGLPVGIRTLRAQEVSMRVFPNPSNGLIQLDIPNQDVKFDDVLTVTDLYGRQLAKTTFGQISSGWDVRTLPAGYYLVVVHDSAGRARGRAGFVVAE